MLVDDGVIVATDDRLAAHHRRGRGRGPTDDPVAAGHPGRTAALRRATDGRAGVGGRPRVPARGIGRLAPEPRRRVDETLERLRRRELIEPTGTYWGDDRSTGSITCSSATPPTGECSRAPAPTCTSRVGEWTDAVPHRSSASTKSRSRTTSSRRTSTGASSDRRRRNASRSAGAAASLLEPRRSARSSATTSRPRPARWSAVDCLPDDDDELAELLSWAVRRCWRRVTWRPVRRC